MGRKGWAGDPPDDDEEARTRIVDATLRIVATPGAPQPSLSDVADALGITRRTVYRYFTGAEELFTAVAEVALEGFVVEVESITAGMDVAEQLIEAVAYIIEKLPHSPQLALLLANDKGNSFSRSMLAPTTIARCRAILKRSHIDWAALDFDDRTVDELVEFLLRTVQSMVMAPSDPPRSGAQLRAYLHRWIAPALS